MKPVPKKVFGMELKPTETDHHVWVGHLHDITVVLRCHTEDAWVASLTIGCVFCSPGTSSVSPAAAFRNLRGHLGNLVLTLRELGVR